MLDVSLRDAKLKCRKFRNNGYATGTIKRKNGDVVPISTLGYKLDAYLNVNGVKPLLDINLEGTELKTQIKSVERHVTKHCVINIDLLEV